MSPEMRCFPLAIIVSNNNGCDLEYMLIMYTNNNDT